MGTRWWLSPFVLWLAGAVCFGAGALAVVAGVQRHDLYVDVDGSVCNGGLVFGTCFDIDRAAFHPPPPDLAAYEPYGFGIVEPAPVAGGILYESRCEVQAIELDGAVSSRAEFGFLSLIAHLGWGLPLGIALMIVAGGLTAFRRQTPIAARPAARAALVGEAGVVTLLMLAIVALVTEPLSATIAGPLVVLMAALLLVTFAAYMLAAALTVGMVLRPATRNAVRVALPLTAGAVLLPAGLITVGLLALSTLWC